MTGLLVAVGLLLLGPAQAPTDGAAPRQLDAGPAGAELDHAALLQRRIAGISQLLEGQLPAELYTTELFQAPLRDEAAVARRISELTQQLAVRRAAVHDGGAGEAGTAPDGAIPTVDALELRVAQLRLAFLQQTQEQRGLLLAAEDQRRAAEHRRAAADAERLRAEQARADAEVAKKRALADADQLRDQRLRALANERANAETVRAAQAQWRRTLAVEERRATERATADHDRAYQLQAQVRQATPGSASADQLFDKVNEEHLLAMSDLANALERLRQMPSATRYVVPEGLSEAGPADAEDSTEATRELLELAALTNRNADELDGYAQRIGQDQADAAAARVRMLHAERIALLHMLSPQMRSKVLGFSEEGFNLLTSELERAELTARWVWPGRGRLLRREAEALKDPMTLLAAVRQVMGVLVVLLVTLWVRRNVSDWLAIIRGRVLRRTRRPRLYAPFINAARALAPEATVLCGVAASFWAIGSAADSASGRVLYAILMGFALYRLAVAGCHRFIAWAASSDALVSDDKSALILRSAQYVGRYVYGVAVILVLSEAVLGRGYLFNVVLDFAWLIGIPATYRLVRWWQPDLVSAYLRLRPGSTAVEAMGRDRSSPRAFLVAVVGFFLVAGTYVIKNLRLYVLNLEQTRRALALLFRAKLERQGDNRDYEEVELPPALLQWLDDPEGLKPIPGQAVVDHFPGADLSATLLRAFLKGGESPPPTVVVGRAGHGKTSWLRRLGVPEASCCVITLDRRVETADAMREALCIALEVQAESFTAVARALRSGPPRVVMVDNLHLALSRAPGGRSAWQHLTELVVATEQRVAWVGTMGFYPYHHATWARVAMPFETTVELPAWDEPDISQLLERRTRVAGFRPVYRHLVITEARTLDADEEDDARTQYLRLIWDYAEGSPRTALECWKRSLVPQEQNVLRVQLFRRPQPQALEALNEAEKFVLAGIIWMDLATQDDLAQSLGYTPAAVRSALARLERVGLLRDLEERGVACHSLWWPEVIRYLRRKHLITD